MGDVRIAEFTRRASLAGFLQKNINVIFKSEKGSKCEEKCCRLKET